MQNFRAWLTTELKTETLRLRLLATGYLTGLYHMT